MKFVVSPPTWYRIYWGLMALGAMGAAYWVVKLAILAAYMEIVLMRARQ